MRMIDLLAVDTKKIYQAAKLLHDAFEAWPTMDSALDEVHESFGDERISRVMVNEQDEVIGWIGGISTYNGNVWELHPLVVQAKLRNQGLGRRMVEDFEEQVRQRGGITITLGTDDEFDLTSLAQQDLYLDISGYIKNFQTQEHPAGFYMRIGYTIVGVVPDANGLGKPDILMAKRV
ncbi:aminoglycoside N-acetyltransferase AAC(6')-Ii [Paenibacillus sp. JCM 10914]|uniref:GNAT family N-acetyltransferase n=1 Tax=Paenibacillus sp. JCM 10914 TaxID=1236974 RepID=UPI0003CC48A8|nr:GNAT family N-acetyltransferase [Paenibacillus sp. JCM 10914]GAE05205.1 aminoglycoside 6'-N-acetyltransferase [Paenibacillus sp. JCM 10914]